MCCTVDPSRGVCLLPHNQPSAGVPMGMPESGSSTRFELANIPRKHNMRVGKVEGRGEGHGVRDINVSGTGAWLGLRLDEVKQPAGERHGPWPYLFD